MAGVDQAQIDKILAGASSEDPEVRLDTLEKELDFVKTSIKRLLIDLRERMNELDNPFTNAAAYADSRFGQQDLRADGEGDSDGDQSPDDVPSSDDLEDSEELMEQLGMTLGDTDLSDLGVIAPLSQDKSPGKLKLQKVHQLFEWVHRGCRRYGHEPTATMIDAYRSMGYISDEASDQIRDIMRIVPETRRDTQDIGPNEFVSELYILNRLLDPDDATLDRDMIEVLMLTHHRPGEQTVGESPSTKRDSSDTWIELLDRI